jgi:hypothetical protein
MGRRKKDDAIYTDATCTPEWLAKLIGRVDLDPCSNPRSHIDAAWSYSLEKGLDGLKLPWEGRVFKNNPFGWPLPWQQKARHELASGRCTELIELCKLDSSTAWWALITGPVEREGRWYYPDRWELHDRVQYEEHPVIIERRRAALLEWERAGGKASKKKKPPPLESSNNFCSVIIHHRFNKPRLNLSSVADLWVRQDPDYQWIGATPNGAARSAPKLYDHRDPELETLG